MRSKRGATAALIASALLFMLFGLFSALICVIINCSKSLLANISPRFVQNLQKRDLGSRGSRAPCRAPYIKQHPFIKVVNPRGSKRGIMSTGIWKRSHFSISRLDEFDPEEFSFPPEEAQKLSKEGKLLCFAPENKDSSDSVLFNQSAYEAGMPLWQCVTNLPAPSPGLNSMNSASSDADSMNNLLLSYKTKAAVSVQMARSMQALISAAQDFENASAVERAASRVLEELESLGNSGAKASSVFIEPDLQTSGLKVLNHEQVFGSRPVLESGNIQELIRQCGANAPEFLAAIASQVRKIKSNASDEEILEFLQSQELPLDSVKYIYLEECSGKLVCSKQAPPKAREPNKHERNQPLGQSFRISSGKYRTLGRSVNPETYLELDCLKLLFDKDELNSAFQAEDLAIWTPSGAESDLLGVLEFKNQISGGAHFKLSSEPFLE